MGAKHLLPQAKDIKNESSENRCDKDDKEPLWRSWGRRKMSNDELKKDVCSYIYTGSGDSRMGLSMNLAYK